MKPAPIDHNRVAPTYREGRALPEATLRAWGATISAFLPAKRPLTVLDLGAGTGIFATAWPQWCECRVVAVEPSAAMRGEAAAPQGPMMAGVGEALAIRDASVDVAWLSTVLHHLPDRAACVAELRRVVAPGGLVLVRGFFADRSRVDWLAFFPGAERARARLPTATDTSDLFAAVGFEAVGALEVDVGTYQTARDAARWARRMREADTLLGAFTTEEFNRGLAALPAAPQDHCLGNALTLLAFARSGRV